MEGEEQEDRIMKNISILTIAALAAFSVMTMVMTTFTLTDVSYEAVTTMPVVSALGAGSSDGSATPIVAALMLLTLLMVFMIMFYIRWLDGKGPNTEKRPKEKKKKGSQKNQVPAAEVKIPDVNVTPSSDVEKVVTDGLSITSPETTDEPVKEKPKANKKDKTQQKEDKQKAKEEARLRKEQEKEAEKKAKAEKKATKKAKTKP